jgi:steroid delta-isomerase-like uncharacterized protein
MKTADLGKKWLDAWNSRTVPAVLDLLAEGGTFNDPLVNKNISKDELASYLQLCWAAFPDLKFTTLSVTVDEESVALEWAMEGTHAGNFLGSPPSDKSIRIPGVSLIRLQGEKFATVKDYWDLKLLQNQLGIKELAKSTRIHIVLVPGFGGFDALGDLHYYAGVTPVFRRWRAEESADLRVAGSILHYFDNLPTASVAVRAERLRRYFAKRIARNEIQPDDTIALVGHSTGGLDIRLLLWNLATKPDEVCRIDGDAGNACAVRNQDMLNQVRRVVFLSVPQSGTNIADWVRSYEGPRRLITDSLGTAFETSRLQRDGRLRRWVTGHLAALADADLLRAAEDAVRESDESQFAKVPADAASAREAFALLWLWTRNIAADFSAINDLVSMHPDGKQAREARQNQEKANWDKQGITTRSYATVGKCPYNAEVLRRQGRWDLARYLLSREAWLSQTGRPETDRIYRYSYRACAGGPFKTATGVNTATVFGTTKTRTIEDWENDGIVNTASMLWPNGTETQLVDADHGDIIGHYKLVEVPRYGADASSATERPGRRYHTYDFLKSGSGFGDKEFSQIWRDALAFCAR